MENQYIIQLTGSPTTREEILTFINSNFIQCFADDEVEHRKDYVSVADILTMHGTLCQTRAWCHARAWLHETPCAQTHYYKSSKRGRAPDCARNELSFYSSVQIWERIVMNHVHEPTKPFSQNNKIEVITISIPTTPSVWKFGKIPSQIDGVQCDKCYQLHPCNQCKPMNRLQMCRKCQFAFLLEKLILGNECFPSPPLYNSIFYSSRITIEIIVRHAQGVRPYEMQNEESENWRIHLLLEWAWYVSERSKRCQFIH